MGEGEAVRGFATHTTKVVQGRAPRCGPAAGWARRRVRAGVRPAAGPGSRWGGEVCGRPRGLRCAEGPGSRWVTSRGVGAEDGEGQVDGARSAGNGRRGDGAAPSRQVCRGLVGDPPNPPGERT